MGYAKSVLNDKPGRQIGWLWQQGVVKGLRARFCVVRSEDQVNDLPPGFRFPDTCRKCKRIIVWQEQHKSMPCPICHFKVGISVVRDTLPFEIESEKFQPTNPKDLADGVYVDVSVRGSNRTIIAIAKILNGDLDVFTFHSTGPIGNTSYAEAEAIRVAKGLYPRMIVYCDEALACQREGAQYLNRRYNTLAHKAARSRINFRENYAPATHTDQRSQTEQTNVRPASNQPAPGSKIISD